MHAMHPEPRASSPLPPAGSVERWCWDFIVGTELQEKLRPQDPPDTSLAANWEDRAPERRLNAAGRPAELEVIARSPRTPGGLHQPANRLRMMHTFAHHELQAAELFAWAVLAFPETPREFKAGAVRLCLEELGHLHLYVDYLRAHGLALGEFPVRDWFWERVSTCASPLAFVSLQGLGLEGSNLDHCARFALAFRDVGDTRAAQVLERVGRDEVTHVSFARQWFERLSGETLNYERWRAVLPAPLTPALMQGRPLNNEARRAAGFDDSFLDALANAGSTTSRATS